MGSLFRLVALSLIVLVLPITVQADGEHSVAFVEAEIVLPMQPYIQQIFIGSGLILSLMCFAWARALRSYSMVILAIFFAIKSFGILVSGGVSLLTLFTENPQLLKVEGLLLACLSHLILFAFTIKFFTLKKFAAKSYQLLIRLSFLMVLAVPFAYFFAQTCVWLLTQILVSISLIALLYAVRQVQEQRLSTIFSLTLLVPLSFNFINYLLHYWQFSAQLINGLDMLAFWLMAIMVTYLMGRKYYYHLRDERLAQQQVLASAKASELAQQKLLALQEESQEQLESRVQERTLELNIALQELEAVNQALKEKNTLDELSGLYNRRYYDEKILAEFRRSRRNLTPLSIILIDIDHFKLVNDSYGHLTGDKCIVEVAKRIQSLLRRSSDVGCRYGGEEFCLILPETDAQGALALAQDICQSTNKQQFIDDDIVIDLTVSCGVATYQQEQGVTPEIIFASADKALYKAKQAGRNQVQVSLLSET